MILRVLLRSCLHGVCVSGELVEWVVDVSEASVVVFWLSIRCWMNAPGVPLYSTKRASFMLIIWRSKPYRQKEPSRRSLQLSLLTVAWTAGWRIIILATVEWLYIPFALSSIAHGRILLDILWYGLPRPNDWCCKHQIKDKHVVFISPGQIVDNSLST